MSEERQYKAEYVSKIPKDSTDWRDILRLIFCCQIKRALKIYRDNKMVSSLGISHKELLEKYVQAEQIETMNKIKMKTASMFTKVVTLFLLYPMLFYFGKLEVKIYIHVIYWMLMIPVIICQVLQIKNGNTIKMTRLICTGLILRILLSNFDFEGKQIGFDYYVRVIGLTINFCACSILTMFLNMFNPKIIMSLTTSIIVATLSSFAW